MSTKRTVRKKPIRRAPGIAALALALMRASVPVIPNNPSFRRAENILGRKLTTAERAKFQSAWNSEIEAYFREIDG